jgi:ubiquinone/menaquinone biosynthesis C-methylase UbiE
MADSTTMGERVLAQRGDLAGTGQVLDSQWEELIWPLVKELDFSVVVDWGAGLGHSSAKLLEHADRMIIVDADQENVNYCRERFAGQPQVECMMNDGVWLPGIKERSASLVYSFDWMVTLDSDVVRDYLQEFRRILRFRGHCFCHHSNYTARPGKDASRSPYGRSFMSREMFAHYAVKSGFSVVKQVVIGWNGVEGLDCLTILRK